VVIFFHFSLLKRENHMKKLKVLFLTSVFFLGSCSTPATIQLVKESRSGFKDAAYPGEIQIVGKDSTSVSV
jgi:hypothetical protein